MFENQNTVDFHWDEIPFARAYEEPDDEETLDLPSVQLETKKLATGPVNGMDLPEPVTLLAKMAAIKEAVFTTAQPEKNEIPVMPKVSAFDSPTPMGALTMKDSLSLEDAWFYEKPNYETAAPIVEAAPKKKGWFASFTDKMTKAVEKFGSFLDKAVPAVSVAALAMTLGTAASQISDFNKVSSPTTAEPVHMSAFAKAVEVTPVEIVQNASGTNASYLHSERSHAHFVSQLEKWGGFRTVLDHPAVKEAKTTAQMINLVEQYFGEKVADLIELNVKALHQPAPLSV